MQFPFPTRWTLAALALTVACADPATPAATDAAAGDTTVATDLGATDAATAPGDGQALDAADGQIADTVADSAAKPDAVAADGQALGDGSGTTADATVVDALILDAAKPDAVPPDAVPADAAAPDTLTDANNGDNVMQTVICNGAKPEFGGFATGCSGAQDCFVLKHQADCCGTLVAWGFANSAKAAAEAGEAKCLPQWPGCGCASQATVGEDGNVDLVGAGFVAECLQGQCRAVLAKLPVACTGDPATFPAFDKACKANADCAVAVHQIDCCGTQIATGVSATAKADFEAAESQCKAQFPKCKCPQQPTKADDGKTTADGKSFQVQCLAGVCKTSVP